MEAMARLEALRRLVRENWLSNEPSAEHQAVLGRKVAGMLPARLGLHWHEALQR